MPYRLFCLGLLAGSLCLGCGKTEDESPAQSAAPLEGNWILTITQDIQEAHRGDYRDVSTVLFAIKHADGQYQAEILGRKPALSRAKLKQFEVKQDQVHIVLSYDSYAFDFLGTVDATLVRGTMHQGGFHIEPASLVKTTVRDISELQSFPHPLNSLEHQKLLFEASQDNSEDISLFENFESFRKFYDAHPDSPLSIIMYHALVNVLPDKAKTEAEVQVFAKAYLKLAGVWGERMKTLARFNLGKSLARESQFADLSLKYLQEAESRWDPATIAEIKEPLDLFRKVAQGSKSHQQAQAAFAGVKAGRAEELDSLRRLSEQSPFDPVLMHLRAEAARITDQHDEALKYNAQLAIWPRLQSTLQAERVWQEGDRKLPEGRLLELWVKQHGSEAGLEDYKNQIYTEALELIARQIGSPAASPTGNRVGVMELFTGTNCPPCLGADLATGALEKIYPQSNLVVLRYHVHTNGLDPLSHPRNMSRFESLLGSDPQAQFSTPSVFINGKPAASGVGGVLDHAPLIGKSLLAEIRPSLEDATPIQFQLSAYEHEDEISVSAQLTGIPESYRDKLRVLLLLVERDLVFPSPNGIRRHEMLVRWFFEDGNGLALPSAGDFQFAGKTSLKEIRDLLDTSTRDFAKEIKTEVKTIPLDLKGLSLVALVHDAESREILQAAVLPVEVLDTSPLRPPVAPTLPLPRLPASAPATGPILILPNAEIPPAKAEKPRGE